MPERLTARISVSASQIKDFDRCERAWWLASVARAPDDANAGGQYLLQGDLFDEAVQRFSAKMDLATDDLVGSVRAKPGLRGAALTTPEEDWSRMAERAQRMLRAVQHHLPAPKTAKVQHRYRVLVPGYEDRGGVVITGALDLRRPGEVWDTKSTTDRGPGRGRDRDTPPYALTDATTPGGNTNPLADDVQASLYAWCEFMEDPLRLSVRCTWVYASKPSTGSPQGWAVSHVFTRAETLAWFASYVRPRIDRMVVLHEASEFELDQRIARAEHRGGLSCLRCFRKLACNPFDGKQALDIEQALLTNVIPPWRVTRSRQYAALCSPDATTQTGTSTPTTAGEASASATAGVTQPKPSIPTSVPGQDLISLLTASITTETTSLATSDGLQEKSRREASRSPGTRDTATSTPTPGAGALSSSIATSAITQHSTRPSPLETNTEKENSSMSFDIKAARAAQAARLAAGGPAPGPLVAALEESLETQLSASVRALAESVTNGLADNRSADVLVRPADNRSADVLVRPAVNRPDAPPNPNAPGAPQALVVIETTGVEAPKDEAAAPGPTAVAEQTAAAALASEPRRGRGRPRKPAVVSDPLVSANEASVTTPVGASAQLEELEAFATAAQGIADQANRLVSDLNAALRARGVRL
jgi:hypothetical protein